MVFGVLVNYLKTLFIVVITWDKVKLYYKSCLSEVCVKWNMQWYKSKDCKFHIYMIEKYIHFRESIQKIEESNSFEQINLIFLTLQVELYTLVHTCKYKHCVCGCFICMHICASRPMLCMHAHFVQSVNKVVTTLGAQI